MVDIINHYKPKYFLLENVKMKKEYQDVISEYLGVQPIEINSALVSAQNRKRLYRTNIPGIGQPKDKGILLKDILEVEVDQKYNISPIQREKLQAYESNARISPLDGKSYTLNTMQGGHRQPKIAYAPGSREFLATGRRDYKDPQIIQRPRGFNKGGSHFEKSPTLSKNSWEQNNILHSGLEIRKLTPVECERLQTVPDNFTSCVSNSQRYKALGNGRTVDVIAHIFKHIKTGNTP